MALQQPIAHGRTCCSARASNVSLPQPMAHGRNCCCAHANTRRSFHGLPPSRVRLNRLCSKTITTVNEASCSRHHLHASRLPRRPCPRPPSSDRTTSFAQSGHSFVPGHQSPACRSTHYLVHPRSLPYTAQRLVLPAPPRAVSTPTDLHTLPADLCTSTSLWISDPSFIASFRRHGLCHCSMPPRPS